MNYSENRKLNNLELRDLYNDSLNQLISLDGMHETIIAQLLSYAQQANMAAISFIDDLCKANPKTTFDYWSKTHNHYNESNSIIDWITSYEENTILPIPVESNERKPKKPAAGNSKDTLKEQITHEDRLTIANKIITKYKGIKGFRLRILYEALIELNLFQGGRTASQFHRCCQNDFGDVGSDTAMEKGRFERGQELKNGDYVKSPHDEIFDNVILFLKSIIDTK